MGSVFPVQENHPKLKVAVIGYQKMRLVILLDLVITHQMRAMFVRSLHEQFPGYAPPNRRSEKHAT